MVATISRPKRKGEEGQGRKCSQLESSRTQWSLLAALRGYSVPDLRGR